MLLLAEALGAVFWESVLPAVSDAFTSAAVVAVVVGLHAARDAAIIASIRIETVFFICTFSFPISKY